MQTIFKAETVSPCITRIFGVGGELMYLVEGVKKAILIDTGIGEGNLRSFVKTMTRKPITVILTHGHLDHAMGINGFDQVYLSPADWTIFENSKDILKRRLFLKNRSGDEPMPFELCEVESPDFIPLMEGKKFELGNISLEIYSVPGHTPGSVAVLFPEERILLTGDSCNNFTFLFKKNECLSVQAYERTLRQFYDKVKNRYERILLSHRSGEGAKDLIENVIQVCDDIMKNRSDNQPYSFMERSGYIAKAVDADHRRLDGKFGNIVFSADNIWENK